MSYDFALSDNKIWRSSVLTNFSFNISEVTIILTKCSYLENYVVTFLHNFFSNVHTHFSDRNANAYLYGRAYNWFF